MKHEKATEQIQEAAALYSLGALSQHEARAFDLHVREGCTVCEQALRGFESVEAGLGLSAPEQLPSAYLRDLLMARIEREGPPALPLAVDPLQDAQPEMKMLFAPPPPRRSFLPWATAAALLIVALGSLELWRETRRMLERQQELTAEARLETDDARTELERERARGRELDQFKAALSSSDSRLILLGGQPPAPTSTVQIYWDTRNSKWLVVGNLPPTPSGKVYQLWFVTADAKISAGLIPTDTSGRAFTLIDVPSDLVGLAAAAITLEPEGGSPQPTMPIYVLGKVG